LLSAAIIKGMAMRRYAVRFTANTPPTQLICFQQVRRRVIQSATVPLYSGHFLTQIRT